MDIVERFKKFNDGDHVNFFYITLAADYGEPFHFDGTTLQLPWVGEVNVASRPGGRIWTKYN